MIPVYYAIEGKTDEPVARKILQAAGLIPGKRFITLGKAKLNKKNYRIGTPRLKGAPGW